YPFVTSSNPTAGGACTGTGIGPTRIDRVIGIVKAYTTRVGAGPFPTELVDAWVEYLQVTGGEVGVNTGRPRRCGWYDALMIRHAVRINGFTDIVLTKLDVLTGIDEVPICTGYDVDGVIHREMPMTQTEFHHATPVYETLPGWTEDLSEARTFEELPENARSYVLRLEEPAGCRVSAIGVGADGAATVAVHDRLPEAAGWPGDPSYRPRGGQTRAALVGDRPRGRGTRGARPRRAPYPGAVRRGVPRRRRRAAGPALCRGAGPRRNPAHPRHAAGGGGDRCRDLARPGGR